MAVEFTIGDYKYQVIDSTTNVGVCVVDNTKSSYSDIPSTVSYNGTTYTVTRLYIILSSSPNGGCFYGCTNLTTSPTIPNSIIDMEGAFKSCTSLVNAPNIPNSVTILSACFRGCTSLVTAPEIPDSVTNMSGCFRDCTSLVNAPIIPNSVTNISYCFSGCSSLTGEIKVYNIPTAWTYTFNGTTSSIIIITTEKNNYTWNNIISNYNNITTLVNLIVNNDYECRVIDSINNYVSIKTIDKNKVSYNKIPDKINFYSSLYTSYSDSNTDLTYKLASNYISEGTELIVDIIIDDEINYKLELVIGTDMTYYDPATKYRISYNGSTNEISSEDYQGMPVAFLYKLYYKNNIFKVVDVSSCFKGCINLTGNLEVSNNPLYYINAFKNTVEQINIINYNKLAGTTWKSIANQYNNVSYTYAFSEDEFDSQFDTTSLTNSLVIGRQSTNNDIGKLVSLKNIKFNNELFVELDEDTIEVQELINELNWVEVYS